MKNGLTQVEVFLKRDSLFYRAIYTSGRAKEGNFSTAPETVVAFVQSSDRKDHVVQRTKNGNILYQYDIYYA